MLNLLIKDFKIALSNQDSITKENSWLVKIQRTTQDFSKWQKISNHTQTFG